MPDKKTYNVKVNEFIFSFNQEDIDAADLVKRSATEFNLLKDHLSVNATLLAADRTAKKISLELEGENYDIEIRDELDLMVEKMGFNSSSGKHIKEIKAPMPGLVLEISVANGQELNEGDKVLILEAMKMENSITIPVKATVKRIAVKAGQAVEKGQLLVELE